jgi:uncharacterized SAM-binding protein YcdF (DUF218 family)
MLMRRRMVWVPTLWGGLLLLAFAALAAVGLARGASGFLAVDAPARGVDGGGARTLVVEGWLDPPELLQAVTAYRRGHYERIVTTGGPLDPADDPAGLGNYALRAAGVLRAHGLANAAIVAVPAPPTTRDRTWHSAAALRDWARAEPRPLGAVDVFTAGLHARRSRQVYRMALGEAVEVGVMGATASGFDAEHWWRSSAGTKAVMGEALSLAWTDCCFWP